MTTILTIILTCAVVGLAGLGVRIWYEMCTEWFEPPLTKQQQGVLLMWRAGAIKG